jgi:hypothetical protein
MLRETRAKSASYDSRNDTLVLYAEDDCGSGTRGAQLLLDAKGFLVGVDLDGAGMERLVVMLGPHEAVAKTTSARVQVSGESVTVQGAKKTVRGDEKNPYV